MTIEELSLEVEGLLGRLREDNPSPEEKELLLVAIDAIRFISSTGHSYDFEDYRNSFSAQEPPPVVAVFKTREEADTWFAQQADPPAQAVIQIGNEPYLAVNHRNVRHRAIYPFSLARRLDPNEG
jgi:hypothetical protein